MSEHRDQADPSPTLNIGHLVAGTHAEGPGSRFAIWVQGCPLRCPGCCNPELLPVTGGRTYTVPALVERVAATAGIEGISLLGGEPFAQAPGLAELARHCRERGLSVMVYSGYTLARLRRRDAASRRLLAQTDLLVDGVYDQRQPETRRRWIGSANQRLHFLSDRYRADDPRFYESNTVELRLGGGRVSINGWPAVGLLHRGEPR
jgi:anaerobic ribonucleoside-triphosphate reductase activating protein